MAPKKPTPPPASPKKNPPGFQKGRAKTGGKKKGTPNKKTLYKQTVEKLREQEKERRGAHINEDGVEVDKHGRVLGPIYGITPLDFMLGVMNDRTMPTGFRAAAAKDVAPYVHPKLASVEVKQKSVVVNTDSASLKKNNKALTADELSKLYKNILDDE